MSEDKLTVEQFGNVNKKNSKWFVGIIVGSFIFAFASIPLYRIICKQFDPGGSTYFNGLTQSYEPTAPVDTSRQVKIRFTTNVERQLPWRFKHGQEFATVNPGAKTNASFQVTNTSDRPVTGKAVYDINPPQAGAYFKKVECFCFREQELAAGETMDLPLVFWFESDLPKDIKEITIAYTFFNMENSFERDAQERASR